MVATRGAIDPSGGAGGVVFFFPDRHAGFKLVDNPATGLKGRAAVGCAHAHPHRHVADLEVTDAVHGLGGEEVEALARLVEDALSLSLGQFTVGFVFEGGDGLAVVMVAHPALEGRTGPRLIMRQPPREGGGLDGAVLQAKMHAPTKERRVVFANSNWKFAALPVLNTEDGLAVFDDLMDGALVVVDALEHGDPDVT